MGSHPRCGLRPDPWSGRLPAGPSRSERGGVPAGTARGAGARSGRALYLKTLSIAGGPGRGPVTGVTSLAMDGTSPGL